MIIMIILNVGLARYYKVIFSNSSYLNLLLRTNRRGIIIVYIEYQSVCPFVEIGSHHPIPCKGVCLPLGPKGGSDTPSRVRGWRDPVRTTGQKPWHSVYSGTNYNPRDRIPPFQRWQSKRRLISS